MNKELDQIAESVIQKLRGKVIIHRYDSVSTNSIYLKFDYGVACSLRISDHNGYKHLDYRYNILKSMENCPCKTESIHHSHKKMFYSPKMISACCKDILAEKRTREARYRSYQAVVLKAKQEATKDKGFWHGAKLVNNPFKWAE